MTRSLDDAMGMTPAERAELRARVERLALGHAKRRLFQAASRAQDAPRDSIQQWDARTSANDARTALSLTLDANVDDVHPANGTHR